MNQAAITCPVVRTSEGRRSSRRARRRPARVKEFRRGRGKGEETREKVETSVDRWRRVCGRGGDAVGELQLHKNIAFIYVHFVVS